MTESKVIAQSEWATMREIVAGGSKYLAMETAPAACVLLVDKENHVYLMRQSREESDGVFLKTVGGYLRSGETHEACLARNLRDKVGIEATEFHEVTRTYGYGEVVKVPIVLYLCVKWEVVRTGKYELLKYEAKELRYLLIDPIVYDDVTRLQILFFLIDF